MGTPRAGLAALGLLLVAALALRLHDPLRDPWLGAEDPWMHGVYLNVHLDAGTFSRERVHGPSVYPPGLHALLGAFHAGAGIAFEDVARILPPLLGALSVAGAFAAGARLASPRAGLAAAAVLAVTPEHVARTNLLFPTALDLALVPWFALAVVEARDDGRWAAVAIVIALALLAAHPWIFALIAPAFIFWGAFEALAGARPGALFKALAAPAAAVALVPAWMAFGRFWTLSPERVADGLERGGALLTAAVPLLVGVAVFAALWRGRRPAPRSARGAVGAFIILAGIAFVAFLAGPAPAYLVDYEGMLGWVAPAAAAAGLVAGVGERGPLWRLGAAMVLVTLPLSALDLFGVWFLPHRVVAYLTMGLAFLAGHAAATWKPTRASAAIVLAFAIVAAGYPAAAETEPWLRYHDAHDRAAISEAARLLAADPASRALVVSWQSEQTIMAMGPWSQIVFDAPFFADAAHRASVLAEARAEGRTLYVVVDGYAIVPGNTQGFESWDAAFLAERPFESVVAPPEGTVAGGLWRVSPL